MKLKHYFIYILFITVFIISCKTTEIESEKETAEEPAVVTEISEPETFDEDEDVIVIDEIQEDNEEYLRSINNIQTSESISIKEFSDDKAAILAIIEKLSTIMENGDIDGWLEYIDADSKRYYSNPANLRKAQKKLPNRLLELKNIGDYFKYVFIPARKQSKVDEIRYISKTNIKAVEVKEDKSVIVYYFFTKSGDKWFVSIPPL